MRWYISYRPEDKGFVSRMRFQLLDLLPGLEVQQSDPHRNVQSINSIIEKSDILLVVIGAGWNRNDPQAHNHPDAEGDHIRQELTAAFHFSHIKIAPLLIEDTRMPGKADLPPALSRFAKINASSIRDATFEQDIKKVVDMLRSPDDGSSWSPSVEYGTIQINVNKGNLVKRYLETDYPPVTVIIDGEDVGTMRLLNKGFEHKVLPGEHVVAIRTGDKPVRQCETRVAVRQGKISVLQAERNLFWGSISLRPVS